MFSSVRWPLMLAFMMLTVTCVGAIELVVFRDVRHNYLETVKENLNRDCTFVANLMASHMDKALLTSSERKLITDEMGRLSLRIQGRMCIINWKGDVLEDSAQRSGDNLVHRAEVREALHGNAEFTVRGLEYASEAPKLRARAESDPEHREDVEAEEELEDVDEPTAYVAVPMLAHGQVTGAVYASRPIGDMQLMLQHLRELLYEVALATLALAFLLSFLLAGWLTAPLRALTRAARRLGEGHLDERLPVGRRDEVGTLASSFNDMASSLKTQHERLLQFVSDSSHELKTPLTSLRSLFEALEGGAIDQPETARKFLDYIHLDLDRMDKLVGDLLQLHKLDQAVLRLTMVEIELVPFLRALADQYSARLAPARLELEASPATVSADPDRLRQVLTNLLENARRAVREAGEPWIRLRTQGGEVWVEDNGLGLTPEQLDRIFDRFYRVDSSRSRDDGGTGLGLTITRGLVEAMGGALRAESDGLGQGARFCVALERVRGTN